MKQAMASQRRVAPTERMYNPLEPRSVQPSAQLPPKLVSPKARKLRRVGKSLIVAGSIAFPVGVLAYFVIPFLMMVSAVALESSMQSGAVQTLVMVVYALFMILASFAFMLGPPLAIAGLVVLWLAENEDKQARRR